MTVETANEIGSVLIMAGGKGTRMRNPNKPLIMVGGATLIDKVIEFATSFSRRIFMCSSPSAPLVMRRYHSGPARLIVSEGNGYVPDLTHCLSILNDFPVLLLPADILITDSDTLREAILYSLQTSDSVTSILQEGEFTGIGIFRHRNMSDAHVHYSSVEIPGKFCININTESDVSTALKFIDQDQSRR